MNTSAERTKGAVLDQILDRARWAPSGDNRQTWCFEVVDDAHVVVHAHDTRLDCVYDLDGSASQIGLGALLETIRIAASAHRLRITATRREDSSIEEPVVDVRFVADPAVVVDPLTACIEKRSVFRRPLSRRALTDSERRALAESVGPDYDLLWQEGPARTRMAALLFRSAKLRLTMPEAYLVHRDAIEWGVRFSEDRVPEAAVGLDPMTAFLMRWVMKSWQRVRFFNRFLAGTWIPRIQLDVLPALMCAGHFFLVARHECRSIDDHVEAGRAVQRLWLTVTRLGLQLQPELTPLIFARYVRTGIEFSTTAGMNAGAAVIATDLERRIGADAAARTVFMGRVGAGESATARSTRLPISELTFDPTAIRPGQKLRRTSR